MKRERPGATGAPLEKALAQIERRNPKLAEKIVRDAARKAQVEHGEASAPHAAALADVAVVLARLGEPALGDAVREARAAASKLDAAAGKALLRRLDDVVPEPPARAPAAAEPRAPRERKKPAPAPAPPAPQAKTAAHGLVEQARLLVRSGDLAGAERSAVEAAGAIAGPDDPLRGTALALAAEARLRRDPGASPFHDLGEEKPAVVEAIVDEVLGRIDAFHGDQAPLAARLLVALRRALDARGLELAVAHALPPAETPERSHALSALAAAFQARGNTARAVDALLALADLELARPGAGRALAVLTDAVARADEAGEAALRSGARRRLGAALAAAGRLEDAEVELDDAVRLVARTPDAEVRGRARVAYAVVLDELGDREEARRQLTSSLRDLREDAPEAARARELLGKLGGAPAGRAGGRRP